MHMRSGRGRRACVYDTATHMHRYVWLRPPCAHARLAPMHGCMTLHVSLQRARPQPPLVQRF